MGQLLAERTAVVTGAASGNGRSIALSFADHGADVVVADVREHPREGGRPTHEVIEDDAKASATFVDCDVAEREDLETAVDAAEAFGGIDVMVNNAGILRETSFLDVSEAEYREVMDVNVGGVYFGA